MSRSRLWLLGSVGALACCVTLSGQTVVIRHTEGVVHGFLALRTLDGMTAASVWLSRRGLGGSQPDEVKRMLAEGQTRLAADAEWVKAQRGRLQSAQTSLDQAFNALISQAGASADARK